MIVHTPLGEAGASPSQRPDNRPDGAQKMTAWIKKWNQSPLVRGEAGMQPLSITPCGGFMRLPWQRRGHPEGRMDCHGAMPGLLTGAMCYAHSFVNLLWSRLI
jgi:hypothetical protein